MPKYATRLAEDKYVIWSTIVDAPITYAQRREDMIALLSARNDNDWDWAVQAVAEADRNGANHGETLKSVLAGNRAGPNEERLTLAQILEMYESPESAARFEKKWNAAKAKKAKKIAADKKLAKGRTK